MSGGYGAGKGDHHGGPSLDSSRQPRMFGVSEQESPTLALALAPRGG
jgi:hypothetical protein